MNKCKDCKWWKYDEADTGFCNKLSQENNRPGCSEACIWAWAGEPTIYIMTKDDFGCVLWEKKDELLKDIFSKEGRGNEDE